MSVIVYVVGPKGNGQPEHAWMLAAQREIAERYALAMDGQVFEREIPSVQVNYG